jgi:hypothetical protein
MGNVPRRAQKKYPSMMHVTSRGKERCDGCDTVRVVDRGAVAKIEGGRRMKKSPTSRNPWGKTTGRCRHVVPVEHEQSSRK